MTVRDIITNYLKEHGFDGLCGRDCQCHVDDICQPYNKLNLDSCRPGYTTLFSNCPKFCAGYKKCRLVLIGKQEKWDGVICTRIPE